MKIHTKAQTLTSAAPGALSASFEPPDGAQSVNAQVLLVDNVPTLVVTWVELTQAELNELRYAQARAQGAAPGPVLT
jgi:hypothetical protein